MLIVDELLTGVKLKKINRKLSKFYGKKIFLPSKSLMKVKNKKMFKEHTFVQI